MSLQTLLEQIKDLEEGNRSEKIETINGVYDTTEIFLTSSGEGKDAKHLVRFSGECMFKIEDLPKVIKTLEQIKRRF